MLPSPAVMCGIMPKRSEDKLHRIAGTASPSEIVVTPTAPTQTPTSALGVAPSHGRGGWVLTGPWPNTRPNCTLVCRTSLRQRWEAVFPIFLSGPQGGGQTPLVP